jgi:hypothetical protein
MYDGAELKAGTAESELAIKDLASTVDTATSDINTSLRSMDDGVSSSAAAMDDGTATAKASMTDMASTAREEVPMAMLDMQDGVSGAAQGIAGAMATLGPGGTVVASLISGFVIMKNRADAAAQAMRDSINGALSAIEVKAATTNRAIERMYEKQLNFEATLEKMGDGDATKGYEKIAEYAAALGVETEDVVAFVQGRQIPAAERVAELIAEQQRLLAASGQSLRENHGTMGEQAVVAGTLTRLAAEEEDVRQRTLAIERDARDYLLDQKNAQRDTAEQVAYSADEAYRLYQNMEKARREAEGLGLAVGNAARDAAAVALALAGD